MTLEEGETSSKCDVASLAARRPMETPNSKRCEGRFVSFWQTCDVSKQGQHRTHDVSDSALLIQQKEAKTIVSSLLMQMRSQVLVLPSPFEEASRFQHRI